MQASSSFSQLQLPELNLIQCQKKHFKIFQSEIFRRGKIACYANECAILW